MPVNSYTLIRNLQRALELKNTDLILIDDPVLLQNRAITYQNVINQISNFIREEYITTAVGVEVENLSFSERVEIAYIQSLKKSPLGLDGITMLNVAEIYYNEFLIQLENTDFGVADGSPLPSDAWHRIWDDGIENFLDYRGRVPSGLDLAGAINSDNTGLYPGQSQEDAFQGFLIGNSGYRFVRGSINTSVEAAINVPNYAVPLLTNLTTQQNDIKPIINDGENGDPRVSNETRPKNVKTLFLQRYKISN